MDLARRFKWFIQRGKRGYADCDVWGFDTYLAKVISGGIAQLRGELHGHPVSMCTCEDLIACQDCGGDVRWELILEQISEGFAVAYSRPYKQNSAIDKARFDRAMKLFHEHFHSLWD